MFRRMSIAFAMSLAVLVLGASGLRAQEGAPNKNAPNPWPAKAEMDKFMGDYEGSWGRPLPHAKAHARVIPQGDGKYQVVLYPMPYPHDDPKGRIELSGQLKDGVVAFGAYINGAHWTGEISDGKLSAWDGKNKSSDQFQLKHLVRHSPTEGMKPPQGAIVMLPFDGKTPPTLDAWEKTSWKPLSDGSVEVVKGELMSKKKFGDIQIHMEFCLPYMPHESGQGRANSGLYIHNRYEVQVLDSFGLISRDDDCGGIYHVAIPKVNACFPPQSWQTYDITFRSARFDENCDVSELPLITVKHNGVIIHDGKWIDNPTPGSAPGHTKKGVFRLQDHLNPVHYRNIWILERNDLPWAPKNN